MIHDLDDAAAVAEALGAPLPGDILKLVTPFLRPGEGVFDGLRRLALHQAWINAFGNQERMAESLRMTQPGVNYALKMSGAMRPRNGRHGLRVA